MNMIFKLLIDIVILQTDGKKMPLVARLSSDIKSMTKFQGDDVCAGCDEQYCNEAPACGYVQVKFS